MTGKRRRSLMPLLAVALCVAFLGLVVVVNVMGQAQSPRVSRPRADMRSIANALDLYKIDTGAYPDQLQSLWEPPAGASRWNGPYLREGPPLDPWGNEYAYFFFGTNQYVILSFGADGRPGGVDEDADLSSRTLNQREAR